MLKEYSLRQYLGIILIAIFVISLIFLPEIGRLIHNIGRNFPDEWVERGIKFALDSYLEDRFKENIRTLAIPRYTLAEDFPPEHIKTFHDFLLFCASVEETRSPNVFFIYAFIQAYITFPTSAIQHLSRIFFYGLGTISGFGVYQHPVVKARLRLNNPVRYEDFLSAVSLSISMVGHYGLRRMFEHAPTQRHYVQMFMHPSRNSFFVENILEPLSHDLKYGEYRGFRFRSENIPQFFREFGEHIYEKRMGEFRHWVDILNQVQGLRLPPSGIIIPEEIILANYYAQTFLLIHNGRLREAYRELYRYRLFPSDFDSYPRLLPHRPYYIYSDEDRYLWFKFLQAELRSAGHTAFADEILEIEIEHYRELINWQLQLRAYLTQKLYEYGDNTSLLTLKELLAKEYAELKNSLFLQSDFEIAIETLRGIDYKARGASSFGSTRGALVLSWINREVIDSKQGIRSETISVYPEPVTWKTAIESIDKQTREEMKKSYERSIHCIRVLAVISERLYLERDLTTMVQLHSKLANNIDINYTPRRVYRRTQRFSALRDTYGDGADFPDLDAQTRLDLRRHDLIANDFWGHQARRRNGDMTVGDVILPWIRVWDEVP